MSEEATKWVLSMSPHVRGSPARPSPSDARGGRSHASLDHGCARTQSSIAPRSGPSGHAPLTELKVELREEQERGTIRLERGKTIIVLRDDLARHAGLPPRPPPPDY